MATKKLREENVDWEDIIKDPSTGAVTVAELTQEMLQTGRMPREKLGFTDEKIELIYGLAYRLYNAGRYLDALPYFRLLVLLDQKQIKYCLALASCLHMLKEYESAAKIYTLAGTLDTEDPISFYHCSDCYRSMNNPAGSIYCLEMAVKRAGNKPEFQVLKDRALLTIAGLKKELLQMAKKSP